MTCDPIVILNFAGVFPRNSPSTKISAASGSVVMFTPNPSALVGATITGVEAVDSPADSADDVDAATASPESESLRVDSLVVARTGAASEG